MNNRKQNNIEAIYNLTPMQEGMLFHSIYNEESTDYFEQLSVSLVGELNTQKFKIACEKVLERHSVLRSSFVYKKLDNMLQVVHKNIDLPFDEYDWRSKPEEDIEKDLNELIEREKKKGFNLSKAPLIRIQLIKLSESEHRLIWNNHHLLFDGWSFPIIFNDLFQIYNSVASDKQILLPPVKQFKDFIQYLEKKDKDKTKNFWKEYLAGYSEKATLPILKNTTLNKDNSYSKLTVELNEEDSALLNKFAKENHITINVLLQAALALLINKYTHKQDLVFGATFSGRPADLLGSEMMVGLFINTLPIRAKIDARENIGKWINRFSNSLTELKDYEHSALVEIQSESELPSKESLFDILFVFENYPMDESLENQEMNLKFKDFKSFEQTNYPLTIVSAPGKQLKIDAAYDQNIISELHVQLLLEHYKNILKYIVSFPTKKIVEIEFLSQDEKNILLPLMSSNPALEKPWIIIEQFEKTVERCPENIAICINDVELTYSQLNKRANKFARLLVEKGCGPEDLVGVYLYPQIEMIIAILAVLKSGAAYVPIDNNYPQERVEHILTDSGSKLLITESELANKIELKSVQYLLLSELDVATKDLDDTNLNVSLSPLNSAYVIYTSGSTGKPKGTVIQNLSAVNLIVDWADSMDVTESSTQLQFSSIGFDMSIPEIFTPLFRGGKIQLIPKEIKQDISSLDKFLLETKITNMVLPPSVLAEIPYFDSPYLKSILSGGEACTWELVDKWTKKYKFINGYGPTEATVGCLWGVYVENIGTATVPIGIPIYNVKAYVLDSFMRPVPIGVPGELYVGENALARGYHKNPDLTASKFLPNPYSEDKGERIYRTGDLVKVLLDSQVEFLGRVDNQIKLRGFRIELGEIEVALKNIPFIDQAVVTVYGQEKALVAFIVSATPDELNFGEIRECLKEKLPIYMVPSFYEIIDSIPLTAHGKIDRKKINDLKLNELIDEDIKNDQLSATEDLVITIVKNVLSIEKVSLRQNFFELGGHSLYATKLASRIRESFEIELPINKIFESKDLKELAKHIDLIKTDSSSSNLVRIIKVERPSEIPLSFAQQRMWFMQKYDPTNISNNIFTSFRLLGDFNTAQFNEAVNIIIERHEILRTFFSDNLGVPNQIISSEFIYNIEVIDFSDSDRQSIENNISKVTKEAKSMIFDLEKLPLFEIKAIKLDTQEYMILLTMHHIISDGWSVNLLINEIMHLYKRKIEDSESNLPPLEIQYADFSIWEKQQLSGETLERQLDYWKNELTGIPSIIDFPLDGNRPSHQTFNGKNYDFELSENLTTNISDFAKKHNFTPYMITLAVFKILLHKYSHQDTIVVGSPIANRNKSEIENLIGFFVNTLVIRTDISAHDHVIDVLKAVRSKTLKANLHQDLPFELLVDKLEVERETSHSPLFQVAFVYQNENDQMLELPNISIEPIIVDTDISKYDFTLYVQIRDGKLHGTFEYNTDLFNTSTIEKLSHHFVTLLEQVVDNPKKKIAKVNLLSPSEQKLAIDKFNSTKSEINYERSISRVFEDIASKFNTNTAVTYSNIDAGTLFTDEVSYLELNENSNKLANYLLKKGVGREQIVAISMERSIDLIVSIIAVLKTGAAFLPIDPGYPNDRINYMLEDSNSTLILSKTNYSSIFTGNKTSRIYLDDVKDEIDRENSNNLNQYIDSSNLAYVIYTSGTTGKPKGTLLQHQGAINLSQVQKEEFYISDSSKILQFASLSFDAFVWETVMALLNGASLNLVHNEIITSSELLLNALKSLKINIITLPPSVLAVMDEKYSDKLDDLKTVIVAGEKCPAELAKRWNNRRRFVNAYGPTETTVCASMYHYREDCKFSPPIGKPISNFRLYILDKNLYPVPDGIIGELFISGISLARGYHNQASLTSDKFIPDPFTIEPGARMYKSGDLVKRLETGDIVFIGRADNQVKLRGFRIELTEIESVLSTYPDVTEAIVMVREDNPGNQQLVAYVILKDNSDIDINQVKAFLRTKLPDYMVPSHYVDLKELPLTPSKKVDYNLLPKPEKLNKNLTSEFVEPTTKEEISIANIGKELLGIDKMGIHDNFFELGGHSLLATQFVSKIKVELNKDISLKLLFENPTIHALLSKIEAIGESSIEVETIIEKHERGEDNLLDLLDEIENMTDEEAKTLLEKEDGSLS